MRSNWWCFGVWYFGPFRKEKARLIYDLRSWMFGFKVYFGAWRINIGPLEFERLMTMDEPTRAP